MGKTFWNFQTLWSSGICNPLCGILHIARHDLCNVSFTQNVTLEFTSPAHFSLHWFGRIFLLFFPISIEQNEITYKCGASGRKSNDLRNWIKPKRKLRNRASSPYEKEEERESLLGHFCGRQHTVGANNEKHHREFSAPLAHRPFCLSPCPLRRPPKLVRLSIRMKPRAGISVCIRSMSAEPNASRILSEITHSRPKRCSGTTPAVRVDACLTACARAHTCDYYFSADRVSSLSCKPLAVFKLENCVFTRKGFPNPCPWIGLL